MKSLFSLLLSFGFLELSWGEEDELSHLNIAIRSQTAVNQSLRNRIEKYRGQIAEAEENVRQMEEAEAAADQAEERIKELQDSFLDLEDKLLDLEAIEAAYRNHFVPKITLQAGQQIATFTDRRGSVFNEVIVTEIAGDSAKLQHSEGLVTLPLTDLPENLLRGSVLAPSNVNGPYKQSVFEMLNYRPRAIINRGAANELEIRTREIRDREIARKKKKAEADWEAEKNAKEKAAAAYLAERIADAKANEEIDEKVAILRQDIVLLVGQRSEVLAAQSAKQTAYASARIKPDRRVYEKEMNGYDEALRKVNASIAALELEIKQLFAQKH